MTNTRHFVLINTDGTVQILQTVQQPDGRWPSVSECLAKWTPLQRQLVVSSKLINKTDLPVDRTFRDSWRHDGTTFLIDMATARETWRNRMRKARLPLLVKLDQDYLRADETSNLTSKQQIAAQKQALRDVTGDPLIEVATTPDELKAVWPAILNS